VREADTFSRSCRTRNGPSTKDPSPNAAFRADRTSRANLPSAESTNNSRCGSRRICWLIEQLGGKLLDDSDPDDKSGQRLSTVVSTGQESDFSIWPNDLESSLDYACARDASSSECSAAGMIGRSTTSHNG